MRGALSAILPLVALLVTACTPTYVPEDRTDRRERVLHVTKHVGGSHHRTLAAGSHWFQSFSNQVLVLDPADGRTVSEVEPEPWGTGGAVVDLALDGTTLWAVADRTAVAEVDVSSPITPRLERVRTADDLGIEPRMVSLAGGDVWISGEGGVVRLRDGKRFLTGEPVARVVQTPAGPATTVRRRIVMVADGRYLGAATELQALPPGFGPEGGYLFVLQGAGSAQVGLMTPAFAETASVAIAGFVRRARVLGEHLVIVTPTELEFWRLKGGKLVDPIHVPLKGARDVDMLRANHFVVAGTFGRAMYRLEREGTEEGDHFYNVQREPGLLELAVTDRRRILAGGREGFWLWRIGGDVELTDKTTNITSITPKRVDTAWGSAALVFDGKDSDVARSVELSHDGTVTLYSPEGSPKITCLALADGDVWLGHEWGVDVLRRVPFSVGAAGTPGAGAGGAGTAGGAPGSTRGAATTPARTGAGSSIAAISRFRFEGPVLFIFPEGLGGGASVVSLHGGFALFRPAPVGDEPVFRGRGDIK